MSSNLREWIGPCLFGLLVFLVISFHSSTWIGTLPEVVLVLLSLSSLMLLRMRAVDRLSLQRPSALLLLVLAVAVAASTLGSVDVISALPRLWLYVSVVLLAAAVYLLYRDTGTIPLAKYCVAMAVAYLPFLAAVLMEFAAADGHLFPNGPNVAYFANVRHFGHASFLAAMGGTALLVLSRRYVLPAFALTSCALFGVIAVGSRGPLLAWILYVGLLCCFCPERWGRLFAFSLAALATISALVWWLDVSALLVTPNLFQRLEQAVQSEIPLDSGRLQIWRDALREITGHPLLGQGPEAYARSGCCNTWVKHPHNFVLQLLMEFGAVGCALLVLLCMQMVRLQGGIRGLQRLVASSPANGALASMLLAYLALGCIDGMFYFAVPLMHFALFCGLFAAGLHQARLK